MATFTGKSMDASSVILGGDFWKKGAKIQGTVVGSFVTQNGTCYNVRLTQSLKIKGKDESIVAVGALKGFQMALQAAGVPDAKLLSGDKIILECTGETKTEHASARIDFKIAVDRP